MEKLSVVIIAKNEERNIARCLASVAWADEIIVLDSGSTDRTIDLCSTFPCRVERTEWLGFGPTKQKAVSLATHTWILSIDADEEVRPDLRDEIRRVLDSDAALRSAAYRLNLRNWYVNRWIRHSGWNKDVHIRLFDKNRAAFNGKLLHESVEVRGSVGTLGGLLYHYSYPDLLSHFKKIMVYGELAAADTAHLGKKVSIVSAILHGFTKFLKMYFFQAGFLDGTTGLVLAVNSGIYTYFKYAMRWERSLRRENPAVDTTT